MIYEDPEWERQCQQLYQQDAERRSVGWAERMAARQHPDWGGKRLVLCSIRYTGKNEVIGCGRHSLLKLASYTTKFTCPHCGTKHRPKGPSQNALWRLAMEGT